VPNLGPHSKRSGFTLLLDVVDSNQQHKIRTRPTYESQHPSFAAAFAAFTMSCKLSLQGCNLLPDYADERRLTAAALAAEFLSRL